MDCLLRRVSVHGRGNKMYGRKQASYAIKPLCSGKAKMGHLVKPTGHVMHQQFNMQQLYALSTLYLCVLYLSENKQRHVPLTA